MSSFRRRFASDSNEMYNIVSKFYIPTANTNVKLSNIDKTEFKAVMIDNVNKVNECTLIQGDGYTYGTQYSFPQLGWHDIVFKFTDKNIKERTSIIGFFLNVTNVREANVPKALPLVTNMNGFFNGCTGIVTVHSFDSHNLRDFSYMFNNCSSLKSISKNTPLDMNQVSGAVNMIDCFKNCTSLEDIGGLDGVKGGFNINNSPLTYTSIMNIINNLPTITESETINFGSSNLSKISNAEKNIATRKGWILQ